MMTAALRDYHARMRRVLEHVDRHSGADLDLDTLSAVAAFSKYHFHRQFTATFGITVHRYVQLTRLKRASYQLAYRMDQRVTDIALDAGYDAPDAFARAFRRQIGQSPSSFRNAPDWGPWQAAFGPFDIARSTIMPNPYTARDVTIRTMPQIPVAIMEHRGDPALLGGTLQRFIAWRRAAGVTPPDSATFTIFPCDPDSTPPEDYRVALCTGTAAPISDGARVTAGTIPGGRCAVLRVTGGTADLEPAARYLYGEWLPASGEEPRDHPLYCQRITLYPDVPEGDAVADLFLPLR